MKAIYDTVLGERDEKILSEIKPGRPAPALGEKKRAANLVGLSDPITKLYGSVRRLLDHQQLGVVLHIVASTPGEGASTIAQGLARRAGTAGHRRVLLVDGHGSSQENSEIPGLLNAVSYGKSVLETAVPVSDSSLHSANLFAPGMAGSIDPKDIRSVYEECRKEFELTVLDCPPISSGMYFDLVPESADGIIFVVQAEKLRPIVIQHTKNTLEEQGGKIFGVVLNKTTRYIPDFVYKMI